MNKSKTLKTITENLAKDFYQDGSSTEYTDAIEDLIMNLTKLTGYDGSLLYRCLSQPQVVGNVSEIKRVIMASLKHKL